MSIVERHTSPDGLLDLIVARSDSDWSIGFDGFPWHTHGDILAATGYSGSPEEATRRFVDDILACRLVIVISRVNGVIRDAWATDDSSKDEVRYSESGETIEKRYWSGECA